MKNSGDQSESRDIVNLHATGQRRILLIPSSNEPKLLPAAHVNELFSEHINTNNNQKSVTDVINCDCSSPDFESRPCSACRLSKRVENLKKENRLTEESWQSLLKCLQLSVKIKTLSSIQARSLRHLLDHLITRSSLVTKNSVTADHWREWLEENLPDSLEKSLQLCGNDLLLRERKRKKRKKRKTARKEKSKDNCRQPISVALYREVAVRQGSYCFWCGVRVVREQLIVSSNRISKNETTIIYLSTDGGLREEVIATVDHLVRVTDGGTNDPENLVISCVNCNQERERLTQAYGRPFSRRKRICRNCGGRFFHPRWGCCSICGDAGGNLFEEFAVLFGKLITRCGQILFSLFRWCFQTKIKLKKS